MMIRKYLVRDFPLSPPPSGNSVKTPDFCENFFFFFRINKGQYYLAPIQHCRSYDMIKMSSILVVDIPVQSFFATRAIVLYVTYPPKRNENKKKKKK